MLELTPENRLRFRIVVLLVARQNGKSTVMKVLALWMLFVWQVKLILGTAQDLSVAEDLWQDVVDMVDDDPDLSKMKLKTVQVNGKKALILRNKARSKYQVKAANRRGGRGASAEVVLLDELREHQNFDAWSAITKTTLTKLDALILCISNAGDLKSVVLWHLRRIAHLALGDPDGIFEVKDDGLRESQDPTLDQFEDFEDDLAIFEWSAAPGRSPGDRDGWREANPAFNRLILEKALVSSFRNDPPATWLTECLCQWPDFVAEGPFPPGQWEAAVDKNSRIADSSPKAFCVDVSHDREVSSIAVAGFRDDGLPHVEVIAQSPGTAWVKAWFADPERVVRLGPVLRTCAQTKGAPVVSLIDDLRTLESVCFEDWQGSDLGSATGDFYDLVRESGWKESDDGVCLRRGLVHLGQPVVNRAVQHAAAKPLGDVWVWNRSASGIDISPLVAMTGALWLLLREPPPEKVSAYETDDLVVV